MRRLALAVLVSLASQRGEAADGLLETRLERRVSGVLAVLGFAAVPDSTTASLSIKSESTGDPRLTQGQLGGAFTIGDSFPLYLEGYLGVARYDPAFVFSGGDRQRRLPTRWTAAAATGGVGWDFPLTESWTLRPIANVMLGYVVSDLKLAERVFDAPALDFLDGGETFAWGAGGSGVLAYARRDPAYEVDVELRYTRLHVEGFAGERSVRGSADAETAAVWSRLRVPTGWEPAGLPTRWVFEAAHSEFLGPNRGALGFGGLTQLGFGVELDTEATWAPVGRTRLLGRYVFGENVSGFSVGFGVSF